MYVQGTTYGALFAFEREVSGVIAQCVVRRFVLVVGRRNVCVVSSRHTIVVCRYFRVGPTISYHLIDAVRIDQRFVASSIYDVTV